MTAFFPPAIVSKCPIWCREIQTSYQGISDNSGPAVLREDLRCWTGRWGWKQPFISCLGTQGPRLLKLAVKESLWKQTALMSQVLIAVFLRQSTTQLCQRKTEQILPSPGILSHSEYCFFCRIFFLRKKRAHVHDRECKRCSGKSIWVALMTLWDIRQLYRTMTPY